jgi:hypothetical protein
MCERSCTLSAIALWSDFDCMAAARDFSDSYKKGGVLRKTTHARAHPRLGPQSSGPERAAVLWRCRRRNRTSRRHGCRGGLATPAPAADFPVSRCLQREVPFQPCRGLAPDLVEAIVNGTQPVALTAERLKRLGPLPLRWDQQRTLLGADDDAAG